MLIRTFDRARPRLMVVSHERSGTHFLMNSLACCYGYVASPWINLDYELGLNFYDPPTIAAFFAQFRECHFANIVKAHHSFDFFQDVFAEVARDFHVFYIYRDPRDVMVSFWKFLRHLSWNEGPRTTTCAEFLRAEPSGQMMRYQTRQEPSVIHRWRSHVEGWTAGVPAQLRDRVTLVRYRDLALDYERTMRSFASVIGEEPHTLMKPSPQENVILPSAGRIGAHREEMDETDLELFQTWAGPTMARLGCDDG